MLDGLTRFGLMNPSGTRIAITAASSPTSRRATTLRHPDRRPSPTLTTSDSSRALMTSRSAVEVAPTSRPESSRPVAANPMSIWLACSASNSAVIVPWCIT